MIIPDLQKELSYWVEKLRLGNWKIAIRYEPDPRAPDTDAPVYGYCVRQLDIPSADIVIRTPVSEPDVAETHDTIVHELLHCRIANPEGSRVLEENAVWTLAPLLTELRLNAPTKAMILCKALARRGTPITARSRAQKEGYAKMDPEKLAALAMQAGQLIAEEGLPENVKALLQELITLAAGGTAPEMPAEGEGAPIEGKMPEEAPMGLQKQDDDSKAKLAKIHALLAKLGFASAPATAPTMGGEVQLKALKDEMTADRAAAVDATLDTRPDLKDKPKALARLRELGIREGVSRLREDLAELVPAPKVEPKTEVRAKLGMDAAPRRGGGAATTMFKPSGNPDMMRRLRVSAEEDEGVSVPGCKLLDAAERESTGKLMIMSIWDALPALRKASQANVKRQTRRAGGEV